MRIEGDGSAILEDGTRLRWMPDPILGAVGLITCSLEPLDAAANDRLALLFQVFLGGHRAQGAAKPWLLIDGSAPCEVERRFNLLVHEFKWINFYGGGLAIIDPSPIVHEAFSESAVAGYIGVFQPRDGVSAQNRALQWFRDPQWSAPDTLS